MNRQSVSSSGEPKYQLISFQIKSDIQDGSMNPGELIPSETALATRFNVSRETVRKSLKELEHQGFLYVRAGKGYFVAQPEHDHFLLTFSDEQEGLVSKIHRTNIITPTAEIRRALNLNPEKRVIKISYLYLKSETPVAFELRYLPYDKGMPLIESEIKYTVFPDLVASTTAPFAFKIELEIGAETASAEVQEALECESDEPLLVVYRHFIGLNSLPIGFGKRFIRSGYGRLQAVSEYL